MCSCAKCSKHQDCEWEFWSSYLLWKKTMNWTDIHTKRSDTEGFSKLFLKVASWRLLISHTHIMTWLKVEWLRWVNVKSNYLEHTVNPNDVCVIEHICAFFRYSKPIKTHWEFSTKSHTVWKTMFRNSGCQLDACKRHIYMNTYTHIYTYYYI